MPLAMGLRSSHLPHSSSGFASGAQIYQYFINYGIWCLILPAMTRGLYALFFWYGMRYAYKHKTYDYRSFSGGLYGKTKPVMSNLYKLLPDHDRNCTSATTFTAVPHCRHCSGSCGSVH